MMKKIACIALLGLLGLTSQAQQCDTIGQMPWEADFTKNFGCWSQTGNGYWIANDAHAIRGQLNGNITQTTYITLTTPHLLIDCDSTGLRLWWKDVRSYMYPNLRVMVLKADNTRDTLYTADMPTILTQHSVSMAQYVGQTIRIAFEVRLSGSSCSANIRDIGIYAEHAPFGQLAAPAVAAVGESIEAVVDLARGEGPISYAWHSTMLGDLAGGDTLHATYTHPGLDTLTAVASNAYGALRRMAVVRVHDCQSALALPWHEDFAGGDTASYNVCWTINDFTHFDSLMGHDDHGQYHTSYGAYGDGHYGSYMLTPPIALPTSGCEQLALWFEAVGSMEVRICTTGSTDAASFADTLIALAGDEATLAWRTASLANYAGQTVRFGFFQGVGTLTYFSGAKIDLDTLPDLGIIAAPTHSRTDSTISCRTTLLRGDTAGLSLTWHSSLMDTTWTTSGLGPFTITYLRGGTDTITVVATNAYGSDTARTTVTVADCYPVSALPWKYSFDNGLWCWYVAQKAPENQWGASWNTITSPSGNRRDYHAASWSGPSDDTQAGAPDAWLVSKAITIPTDPDMDVHLFWRVQRQSGYAQAECRYSVLASTAADRTDTTAYVSLLCDTTPLARGVWENRSVSLSAFAGQTIHLAFRNHPALAQRYSLVIDDVELRAMAVPQVAVAASGYTFQDGGGTPFYHHADTALFVATLTEGSTSGLTYTWHSTLLDSTIATTSDTLRLCYGMADGLDTLSVTATNAFGSGSASVVVRSAIQNLPFISNLTHTPAMIDDTTVFTVASNFSVVTGLAYTWHSTLLDTTVVVSGDPRPNQLRLVYRTEGVDTVSVVKRNIFGSDSMGVIVGVNSYPLPHINYLAVPASVRTGDTLHCSATINDCSANGLTFAWRSSLLDTTFTTPTPSLALVYDADGTDTLALVVANAYGADTSVATVQVSDCSPRQVPYAEDFNEVAATTATVQGCLPGCWDFTYNGTNVAFAPHVIDSGGYQYISNLTSKALFMVSGNINGYGNTSIAILPPMADSLPTLHIAFDYRFEHDGNGTLEVGYADSSNAFTPVSTLEPHDLTYRRDTVSLATATLPNARIALRWTQSTSWYAVAIDNIAVFHDPAPYNLVADSIGTTYARIGWSASVGATAYRVVVDSVADTVVSTPGLTLEGLTPNTSYTVRVASLSATDTSRYITLQFSTICEEQPLPYVNDFSDLNSAADCWSATAADVDVMPLERLYMSQNGYENRGLVASPVFNHPGNDLVVDFHLQKVGATDRNKATVVAGVMTDPADPATFIAIDTFSANAGPVDCSFTTRALADTAHVAIAFYLGTGNLSYSNYCIVYLDDLRVEASPACSRPVSAEATVLGPSSAELHWQFDTLGAQQPDAVLITLHDLTDADSISFTAHGTDTLLTGLPLVHTFRADIRALCGNDTAAPALSTVFAPEPSPCAEVMGNDRYTWAYPLQASSPYGYSQTLYPATLAAAIDTLFGIALRMGGPNLATRLVDVYIGQTADTVLTTPVSAASLTLAAQGYTLDLSTANPWVKILFTNPVPLDGVSNLIVTIDDNTGSWENPTPFGAHHADMGNTLYYYWDYYGSDVDPFNVNVSLTSSTDVADIRLLGGCATHRCLQPVISLVPDTNSIAVGWSRRGSEDLWVVEYRADSTAAWAPADSTADTLYILSGLNASMHYHVRVGSVCGSDDVVYSQPATAITLCGTVGVPYYQNFLTRYADDLGCWNVRSTTFSESYGFDLGIGAFPLVSPAIGADISQLQVRFKVTGDPNFNPLLRVGVGNADGSVTTWVDSLTLSSSDVQEHIVRLDGYTGSENHLVLHATRVYARLHELTIEPSDHQAIRPTRIEPTVGLRPNPASASVILDAPAGTAIAITDISGRQVRALRTTAPHTTLDISGLAPGAYFVRFATDGLATVRKLVIR